MSAKKILIVTDDAGECFEILYAKHRFTEAGYQPVIAATNLHWTIIPPLPRVAPPTPQPAPPT